VGVGGAWDRTTTRKKKLTEGKIEKGRRNDYHLRTNIGSRKAGRDLGGVFGMEEKPRREESCETKLQKTKGGRSEQQRTPYREFI